MLLLKKQCKSFQFQLVELETNEKETTEIVFVSNLVSIEKARDEAFDLKHDSTEIEDGELCKESDNLIVSVSNNACTYQPKRMFMYHKSLTSTKQLSRRFVMSSTVPFLPCFLHCLLSLLTVCLMKILAEMQRLFFNPFSRLSFQHLLLKQNI